MPPVIEKVFGPRIAFLHPPVDVEKDKVVLAMNELVALQRSLVGPPVANLQMHASEIVTARDDLITGD